MVWHGLRLNHFFVVVVFYDSTFITRLLEAHKQFFFSAVFFFSLKISISLMELITLFHIQRCSRENSQIMQTEFTAGITIMCYLRIFFFFVSCCFYIANSWIHTGMILVHSTECKLNDWAMPIRWIPFRFYFDFSSLL